MILKSSLFILFLSGKNYISSFVATEGFMKNYTRYFFTQFCFLSNSKYYIEQNCTVINCTVLQLLKQNFKKKLFTTPFLMKIYYIISPPLYWCENLNGRLWMMRWGERRKAGLFYLKKHVTFIRDRGKTMNLNFMIYQYFFHQNSYINPDPPQKAKNISDVSSR